MRSLEGINLTSCKAEEVYGFWQTVKWCTYQRTHIKITSRLQSCSPPCVCVSVCSSMVAWCAQLASLQREFSQFQNYWLLKKRGCRWGYCLIVMGTKKLRCRKMTRILMVVLCSMLWCTQRGQAFIFRNPFVAKQNDVRELWIILIDHRTLRHIICHLAMSDNVGDRLGWVLWNVWCGDTVFYTDVPEKRRRQNCFCLQPCQWICLSLTSIALFCTKKSQDKVRTKLELTSPPAGK